MRTRVKREKERRTDRNNIQETARSRENEKIKSEREKQRHIET